MNPNSINEAMETETVVDLFWEWIREGDRGTRPPPPTLFLNQTEARRAEKKKVFRPPPPPRLSQGLDDRSPPPPSLNLKVWIRHWLSPRLVDKF